MIKFKSGSTSLRKALRDWLQDNGELGMVLIEWDNDETRLVTPEPAEVLEALLEDEVFDPTEIDYEIY